MIMNLHTHSHHSPDAQSDTVAQRLAYANSIGLRFLAITDHCEVNRMESAAFYGAEESEMCIYQNRKIAEASITETYAAKSIPSVCRLLCGVELGQIPQNPEGARAIYQDPRLDLAIGSVHELPDLPDFYFLDYSQYEIPVLITAYFEEVLKAAASDAYDILGHLTYGLRYLPDCNAYDITPHIPIIRDIFRTVIRNGKAIELNGSRLKNNPPTTEPDLRLLKLYREMGGKLLTVSTDAHQNEHVGLHLEQLEQLARDAGFSELTYFIRHQPFQTPL